MKRLVVVFLILVAFLAYSIAVQSQVNPDTQDLFGNNEEADVIVVLKEDYNVLQGHGISSYQYKDNFEKKKMMIGEQQENVLKNLKLKKKKEFQRNQMGIMILN